MQVPAVGPPSLVHIVQTTLKTLTPLLGDIGCVPVELLWAALSAATPEELAAIEDATLEGVATRDIRPATWSLWHRHCTAGALPSLTQLPKTLPPLSGPSAVPRTAVPRDSVPADWRTVHEDLMRQLEERRARLGNRLKQQREEEARRKASRSIQASFVAIVDAVTCIIANGQTLKCMQVIEPIDRRRGRGRVSGGRVAARPQTQPGVKNRLLKKLGMPSTVAGPRPPRGGLIRPPPPPRLLPTRSALAGVPPVAAAMQGAKGKEKKAVMLEEDDIFAKKKARR